MYTSGDVDQDVRMCLCVKWISHILKYVVGHVFYAGAREPGVGGKGGNCPPTFCLNGMDMPVPPPKIWQSLGISTLLPPPPRKKSFPRPCFYVLPVSLRRSWFHLLVTCPMTRFGLSTSLLHNLSIFPHDMACQCPTYQCRFFAC